MPYVKLTLVLLVLPLFVQEASSIDIPNIPFDVFEAMMQYIYTGNVDVQPELASELLQVCGQGSLAAAA
jgi:hypothetical protein